MSWKCPTCGRLFKIRNQSHNCEVTSLEHHMAGKEPFIREIFEKLLHIVQSLGKTRISYVKNAVIISAKSTFMAIKLRRLYVDIEFLLDEEMLDFPIHKTVRASKNKIAHFIKIDKPDEVDEQIAEWLRRSYRLNIS